MGALSMAGLGFVLSVTDKMSAPLGRITGRLEKLNKESRQTGMGMGMLGGAFTAAGYGMSKIITSGIKDAVEYEGQLKKLGSITGWGSEKVEQLGKDFDKMTATLPLSSFELANMAIMASKLGIAAKGDVAGLKKVAFEASMLGKALGFSEEQTVAMIGRLGTVYKLMSKEDIFRNMSKEAQVAFKKMSEAQQKAFLAEKLAKNMAGVGAVLTQMSYASSVSADYLTDVALRSGAAGQALQLTVGDVTAMAGMMGDAGAQAQAAGSNMGNLFSMVNKNAAKYADFMGKATGGGKKMAQSWEQLRKSNPREAFIQFMEVLGAQKQRDLQGFSTLTSQLGFNSIRLERVVGALADNAIKGENGMSRLRGMMDSANDTFAKGTATQEAYNKIAQGTGLRWSVLTGSLRNISKAIGKVFLPLINRVLGVFIDLAAKVLDLDDSVIAMGGAILAGVAAFSIIAGAVLLATAAVIIFGSAIWAALWPATLVILGIAAAFGVVMLVLSGFKKDAETWGGFLKRIVMGVFDFVKSAVAGLAQAWEAVKGPLGDAFAEVGSALRGLFETLGIVSDETGKTGTDWVGVFRAMGVAVATVIIVLAKVIKFLIRAATFATMMVQGLWDLTKALTKPGPTIVKMHKDMIKSWKEVGKAVWNMLPPGWQAYLSTELEKSKQIFGTWFGYVKSGASSVGEHFKNTWASLPDPVKNAMIAIKESALKALEPIFYILKKINDEFMKAIGFKQQVADLTGFGGGLMGGIPQEKVAPTSVFKEYATAAKGLAIQAQKQPPPEPKAPVIAPGQVAPTTLQTETSVNVDNQLQNNVKITAQLRMPSGAVENMVAKIVRTQANLVGGAGQTVTTQTTPAK